MADELLNDYGTFAQIPTQLLLSDVSNNAKVLYAQLWGYTAGGAREAFPSRGSLAQLLRASVDTVDRCMRELVGFGAVSVEKRFAENGDQTSNLYRLLVLPRRMGAAPPRRMGAATPRRTDAATPAAPVRPEVEPLELEPTGSKALVPSGPSFEDFWRVYPRRHGKAEALKSFTRATRKVSPELIIAGASRFAADPNLPEQQFIAMASTWLNQERWNDPPLPQRIGRRETVMDAGQRVAEELRLREERAHHERATGELTAH